MDSARDNTEFSKIDQRFVELFPPCIRGSFVPLFREQMRQQKQSKLERLKRESGSSWSSTAFGLSLHVGNMLMVGACPMFSQVVTSKIEDEQNKMLANLGANFTCQLLRQFIFQTTIESRRVEAQFLKQQIRELEQDLKNL